MKRFIIKLIIFCLLPMPLLYGIQFMIDIGLRKSNADLYSKWNDIYDGKINADLIINGSSRAWIHVSPLILDNMLNHNSYNLGSNGWNFEMQNACFKVLLQHNPKPKYVIQTLDSNTLSARETLNEREQFIPYLNDPVIRSAVSKEYKGGFSFAEYYFPLFKYNANLELVKLGLFSYFGFSTVERSKYKGYEGQVFDWDYTFDTFKEKNPAGVKLSVNGKTETEFKEFLDYCKKNEIKVILVYPPEYIEGQLLFTNRKEVISLYRDYAKMFGIPFLDYSNHPISFIKGYFYNSQHLNKEGAEAFSKALAQDLLNLFIISK